MYNINMKRIILTFSMIAMVTLIMAFPISVSAISESQERTIAERCDKIKENLRTVQHSDSRTRVYLGRYYETILSKFITPLNVRLVENNMVDNKLIDNQESFTKSRNSFIADFIEYQKGLEDLIATDCKTEPVKFYDKLTKVRSKRKIVADDTEKMKSLATGQLDLVIKLGEKL